MYENGRTLHQSICYICFYNCSKYQTEQIRPILTEHIITEQLKSQNYPTLFQSIPLPEN